MTPDRPLAPGRRFSRSCRVSVKRQRTRRRRPARQRVPGEIRKILNELAARVLRTLSRGSVQDRHAAATGPERGEKRRGGTGYLSRLGCRLVVIRSEKTVCGVFRQVRRTNDRKNVKNHRVAATTTMIIITI